MFDQVFANLALGFSQAFGGPYIDAVASWPGTPVYDDGGSIVTPGTPVELPCSVQFDDATLAMRQAEGFQQTDVRILILAASIDAPITTEASIVVASGDRAGTWSLLSARRDPVGIGYECAARLIG
ncbi:MAG: hypothetical protein ACK4ZW_08555 [Blastomonas sp.]